MLTRLRVQNLKAFEVQSFALAPLTLLTGLNSMGKSTVLQALLLLRQSWQQGLLKSGEGGALALNGEWASIGTAADAIYDSAGEAEILIEIASERNQARWMYSAQGEEDILPALDQEVEKGIFGESLFTTAFQYIPAERVGPRLSYPTSDFRVRRRGELGRQGEFATHFLEVHGHSHTVLEQMWHEKTKGAGTGAHTLSAQVSQWLQEISPRVILSSQRLDGTDQTRQRWGVETGTHAAARFRATNVGFGLSYILPVLVALLSAQPGSLILIENPEAHMHPRGQRFLGELIARCATVGAQVIVETHSDHLLNGIRLAVVDELVKPSQVKIHYFERQVDEEDGTPYMVVHEPSLGPDGSLSLWPEGFFDEWESALRLLLTKRRGGGDGHAKPVEPGTRPE